MSSRSRFFPLFTVGALIVALALPAQAQRRSTIELGALARATLYDDSVGLDDAWGFGGRLGWFFADNWAIEGDVGLIPAQTTVGAIDVNNTFVHVHLVRALGLGQRMALLVGGGWAYNSFSNGSSVSENGVGGLAGLRLRLGKRLALRADATADYMLDPAIGSDDNLHLGVQAGVSLLLGEGPGDKDKDGVLDDVDRCADTPAGTPVEASGCPDADRDGVADQGDRCRDTPGGVAVDAVGCSDADGDGVVDPQDQCAGTAAGVQVDATGCAMDTDKDGVPDAADRCPTTGAGVPVDATGCPPDSDADGVPDPMDRCPGTAAGMQVDAVGCLPPSPAAPIVLEGVSFLSGSDKLTLASQGPLDRVVVALRERPDLHVMIEGHTDNVGTRDANLRLSKARADAVRAYLVSKGIDARRLGTVGYGPDQPVAGNDTAEGRAQNRRVQLRPQP
jgi:outer membrane protein OmpA-like peptidoglycan-associated protein